MIKGRIMIMSLQKSIDTSSSTDTNIDMNTVKLMGEDLPKPLK